MRKFLMVLALVGAAGSAAAVQLDLNNPNGVAALYAVGAANAMDSIFIVCVDGTGYTCQSGICGNWSTFIPSPVPLAEVADWTPWMLVTVDGRWFFRGAVANHIQWEQIGPSASLGTPPVPSCVGTVPVQGKTLGTVKGLFR